MTIPSLFLPILVPLIAGILVFCVSRIRGAKETVALVAALANLFIAVSLFKTQLSFVHPWAGFGIEFSLRLYHFSAFLLSAAAGFGFLVTLYSLVFMQGRKNTPQFYAFLLISLAFVNGALLANNLLVLLFFWEGLLLTLFGMIAIGHKAAFKTATKAFIIVGISDLCMMVGMALTGHLAGTLTISDIHVSLGGLGSVAFVLLMIGAISKAGAMPFHSWIPDAAIDAPLPFMSILPASLEKILGIYFLARISLDMFQLTAGSWVSVMLMIVGCVTILLAVMMALVQKDYKRLLSYHAISQVGYMILGIGTALPVGIVGGLFHMINHAMYKSCLFLTGGSVEKQAGTTALERLGGLARRMPVTFVCFVITAASISGVPPFNGFFSKELVYDGALERGVIFYVAAVLGSFFTAASFLKLGHAAFLGPVREENKKVREAHWTLMVPMIVIAGGCVLFGLLNALPLRSFIQPILGDARLEGHDFAGLPKNALLIGVTLAVLAAAFINHIFGVRRGGSAVKASDHIYHAPALEEIYDRLTDWVTDDMPSGITNAASRRIRLWHSGNYSTYLMWSLVGLLLVGAYLVYGGGCECIRP
jgi:formate hydrogenlyase subunit 3/multisubunit Na+/H+ antiporter MnhD subunit